MDRQEDSQRSKAAARRTQGAGQLPVRKRTANRVVYLSKCQRPRANRKIILRCCLVVWHVKHSLTSTPRMSSQQAP